MEKRGQYYISAAVIIILVIATTASLTTYVVTRPQPRTIESLSSELTEEGSRIVEYGVHERVDVNSKIKEFTEQDFAPYFLTKTENANVLFIYGNGTNIEGVRYKLEKGGEITANIGSSSTVWNSVTVNSESTILNTTGNNVNVKILGKDYNFELVPGQVFYFVIVQENNGEVFVEASKK